MNLFGFLAPIQNYLLDSRNDPNLIINSSEYVSPEPKLTPSGLSKAEFEEYLEDTTLKLRVANRGRAQTKLKMIRVVFHSREPSRELFNRDTPTTAVWQRKADEGGGVVVPSKEEATEDIFIPIKSVAVLYGARRYPKLGGISLKLISEAGVTYRCPLDWESRTRLLQDLNKVKELEIYSVHP